MNLVIFKEMIFGSSVHVISPKELKKTTNFHDEDGLTATDGQITHKTANTATGQMDKDVEIQTICLQT